jgi:hypothetical protein
MIVKTIKTIIKEKIQMSIKILMWVLAVLGLILAISGGAAMAEQNKGDLQIDSDSHLDGDSAVVGTLQLSLIPPQGLVRVDGLCPEADDFMFSLQERFKLRVLAVYAETDQWRHFVEGLANGEPRKIPSVAIISVTTKMEKKSYDAKASAKERRRYGNLVSLAVNTRILAAIFANRANAKLADKLGRDLDFSYRVGKYAGKFAESERSISFSVLTSLYLFGLRADSFVTASALSVGDKFVFLAWVDPDRSPEGIELTKAKSLSWLNEIGQINL